MADAQSVVYSNKKCWSPCVWAVDDAWFEGGNGQNALFDLFGLGGIHNKSRSLTALVERLEERPSLMASGDARYLQAVASQCCARGFSLCLCNFEWLREHWNAMNCKGSAILLDLNYTNCVSKEIAHEYGLRLIHELIEGVRPTADIFVVTGGPKAFQDALSAHMLEASWWPVRAFPVVSKEPANISRDLACFAQYFEQGNQELPAADLLRSLVRSQQEGWSHPREFNDVPTDCAMRNLFEEDKETIKALFHSEQRETTHSDYAVKLSVLASLLDTSGFSVSCDSHLGARAVHLPWAPYGILWLVKIWNLLYWLAECKLPQHRAMIQLNNGSVCIVVPLDPSNTHDFVMSTSDVQKNGMAATAFTEMDVNNVPKGILERLEREEREMVLTFLSGVRFHGPVTVVLDSARNVVAISWNGIVL